MTAALHRRRRIAMIAVLALLLAGCAAPATDRASNAAVPPPARPRLVASSMAQLQHGPRAPFEVCVATLCPQPTRKSFARTRPDDREKPIALPADPLAMASRATAPSPPPSPARANAAPVAPRARTVTITFASGAALLTPSARRALDAALPDAKAAQVIEIRGRTDALGGRDLNEALARQRAQAVRDYLDSKQLPATTRVRVSAEGACCYVANNDTEQGRAANRRVEIEFKERAELTLGSLRHDPP